MLGPPPGHQVHKDPRRLRLTAVSTPVRPRRSDGPLMRSGGARSGERKRGRLPARPAAESVSVADARASAAWSRAETCPPVWPRQYLSAPRCLRPTLTQQSLTDRPAVARERLDSASNRVRVHPLRTGIKPDD